MESDNSTAKGSITIDPSFDLLVAKVHRNTDQEVIITTVDKVTLALIDVTNQLEQRGSRLSKFGLFLAVAVVLPTSTFKPVLVSADTWQAIFIIAAIGSFVWFLKACWDTRKCPSVEDVISRIKAPTIPPVEPKQEKLQE